MNQSKAAEFVTVLLAAFPRPEVKEATAELYVNEVAKLGSVEAMRAAVESLKFTCRFFPSLAELHEAYRAESNRVEADRRSELRRIELEAPPEPRVVERMNEVAASFGVTERGTETETTRIRRGVQELPEEAPGRCDDCGITDPKAKRRRLGKFALCGSCAESRVRVGERSAAA